MELAWARWTEYLMLETYLYLAQTYFYLALNTHCGYFYLA